MAEVQILQEQKSARDVLAGVFWQNLPACLRLTYDQTCKQL